MYKAIEDTRNEALERGRVTGHLETLAESVRSLKNRLGLSDQQARDALNISNDDWELIVAQL